MKHKTGIWLQIVCRSKRFRTLGSGAVAHLHHADTSVQGGQEVGREEVTSPPRFYLLLFSWFEVTCLFYVLLSDDWFVLVVLLCFRCQGLFSKRLGDGF